MGYLQTKLSLKLIPDQARAQVDLIIEVVNEGFRGNITEIEVAGCVKNTHEQVLDYLHIRPGMDVAPQLLHDLDERLKNSARFRRHDVSLIPLPQTGKLKLRITLSEIGEAPALDQEFDSEGKAALKFYGWLKQIENHPENLEDLTVNFNCNYGETYWDGKVVWSSSGMVFALRGHMNSNQPPVFDCAGVIAGQQMALYSGAQQRKTISGRSFVQLSLFAKAEPQGESYNSTCGAAYSILEAPSQPIGFRFDLEPACIVHLAHILGSNSVSSLDHGVLTLGDTNLTENNSWNLKLDVEDGRLLNFEVRRTNFVIRVVPKTGSFAHTVQEIATRTDSYRIEDQSENTSGLFLPLISTFAPDVIRVVSLLHPNNSPSETFLLKWLSEKADLKRIFSPLDRLTMSTTGSSFVIPIGVGDLDQNMPDGKLDCCGTKGTTPEAMDTMVVFRDFIIQNCDVISPHGSWPWTFLHGLAMYLSGHNEYVGAELQRTLESQDTGPIGYFATLHTLQTYPGRPVAEADYSRGLALISPTSFKKDWRILLDEESVLGSLLANALNDFSSANDVEIMFLVSRLDPDDAAFLLQCVHLIRASHNQPMAEVLWPAVEQHWDKVFLPRLMKNYDSVHSEIADPLSKQAAVLAGQGKLVEAKRLFREALAMQKRLLGDEHFKIAESLLNLAWVVGNQGKWTEAEQLCRETLAMRKKLLGNENTKVADSLSYLAVVLGNQGKWTEAEQLSREAVAMQKKLLGNENSNVAKSLCSLALVLSNEGKLEEAETLNREALAIQKKLLGNDNPSVASTLYNLADVLRSRGKLTEAESMHREGLAMQRRLFGNEHMEVSGELNNLAMVLQAQGKLMEAEAMFREALALSEKLQPDHSFVAIQLNDLADLLRRNGRSTEVSALYKKAAELGNPQAQIALAEMYAKGNDVSKDPAEAIVWYRKAADCGNVQALNSLAWLLATYPDPSFRNGLEAVTMANRAVAATNRKDASSLNTLAAAQAEAGHFEEAVSIQREAIILLNGNAAKDYLLRLNLYKLHSPYRGN